MVLHAQFPVKLQTMLHALSLPVVLFQIGSLHRAPRQPLDYVHLIEKCMPYREFSYKQTSESQLGSANHQFLHWRGVYLTGVSIVFILAKCN